VRRAGLGALWLGALLILVAYATAWLHGGAPTWGVVAMITGAAFTLGGTLVLGAWRGHNTAMIAATAIFLVVVVIAGFSLPLVLAPESSTGALLLGLPVRAAIEIYGVGLLPIVVLPFVFAREFNTADLDQASLAALREECARLRAE
jgi:hypothetical protein